MSGVCNCTPPDNPSVIGACACPVHGMKALREAADAALDWIEQITQWVGPGVPEDRDEVVAQLSEALGEGGMNREGIEAQADYRIKRGPIS